MAYRFALSLLIVTLAYLNGYEALRCYEGSGTPSHPPKLQGTECSEDIQNCLKMISSNIKGDIVGIQYQCGTNGDKENGCGSQDPSEPYKDDLKEMMDKEMSELEKDTEENSGNEDDDEEKEEEDTTQKILTFPPNARISKSEIKNMTNLEDNQPNKSNPRDTDWSGKVEDNVRRSKRDADDNNKHMFCYCDEDLCNNSSSLRGAVYLAGLSLTFALIFNFFIN